MTKKLLKNSLLLFLFGIITLSCSLENEAVHQHEHSKKASYQRKMYDELILDKNFSKAIKQIPKKNVLASSSLNRTVMEEQYGFTIFDAPINVMETDSVISYNLCIQTDSLAKGDFFENLVINSNKFTNTIDAYLVKYNLLSEITPSAHGSFSFDFEPEIKPINYDASTARAFTWCYSYHYEMCHELVPGTQYESPHTPTEACNQQSLIYTHTETRCIVIGESGGTGDSGAFEGSNSNGQSSYGNNTVIINPNPNQGPTPSELKRIREQCFLNTFLSTTQSNWLKSPANAQIRNAIYDFLATQTNYGSGDDLACYPNEAMEFAEELIEILINILNDDTLIESEKNKLINLTIAAFLNNEPWQASPGNYNGIPSLHFTHKRTTYVNGQQCFQYRLDNGDFLAYMNYGEYSDINMKTFYYSQPLKNWYEIPEPSGSTYNHTDVDFIFEAFWGAVYTTTRYCTPLEDAVILIEGRDFDGVTSSRASAGVFILIDLVPGGKALKITKKAGYALSAASPVVRKTVTALYKTQRSLRKQYKLTISTMSAARKGNFGEICTDLDFYEKGYDVLHVNRVNSIDSPIQQGIDHIFKNPQTGEFIIVESKFHGTGGLSTLVDGTRQMSDNWISDGTKTSSDRLWNALNGNLSLYNQIKPSLTTNNYTRVISYIQPDGSINYKYINSNGYEISTPFTN